MILLDWDRPAPQPPGVAAVFGSGLIGGTVIQSLVRATGARQRTIPWQWQNDGHDSRKDVEQAVSETLSRRLDARLAVVWAAGQSGFGSDKAAMERETAALKTIVELARDLGRSLPEAHRSFHLVSSAGGLFEGQVACGRHALPDPLRPYGFGKLAQERLIANDTQLGQRRIYRPSSVYGYAPGARRGLIPTLIAAAAQAHQAKIIGAMTTQRDYVFAPDVGRFIAETLLRPGSAPLDTALLAQGRPTAIFEIIHMIEAATGAPLFLQIDPNPDNALDNSFLPSALPRGFHPASLTEGIALTAAAVTRDHFSGAGV